MLSLDVYLPSPRPATPGRPLLVVHDGFWAAGQRGEASLASRALAERYRAMSPTERVTGAAPRTLLAQGGRDQFVAPDQMDRLAARLAAPGAPHETLFIPYAQHAFDFVPGSFSGQLLEATLLAFLRVGH